MDGACGSARDRLGRTLGGKYRLVDVLGAGGTAVVYRATFRGQAVAVKVLHDHLSRSEEVCRRFVREGQVGNVLDHPGTVRVLDHGATEDECPYLVLELLEGESLEELRVRSGGRLELMETLDFCDQLLAVLEVAHAKNIVHRDIKPANLFVTTSGALKVLDFGIARLTDDTSATSTKTGQMVGTPAFMPPEQALSRPREVDARTDIWSVGATLFTLLSGEHVHLAETSSEHLVKAATLHARSLARALPEVPSNVEALVARCLAFDKNERWPSAGAMRAALAVVRRDPGRRIGAPRSLPPDAAPRVHLATFPGLGPIDPRGSPTILSTDGRGPPIVDRISEMNMSLTSDPGFYLTRPRRKRLVPFAFASALLLTTVALVSMLSVHALRPLHTPPSPAVGGGAAHVPSGPEGIAPSQAAWSRLEAPIVIVPPVVVPPGSAPPPRSGDGAVPGAPSSPSASSSVRAPVVSVSAPARRPPIAAGASSTTSPAPPARTGAASARKPSGEPARKDVYRPF